MGRESGNGPIMAQSSIALLQERFRQLERAKELREERELSKVISLSEPNNLSFTNINYYNNPTSLHYETEHHHMFFRPPPPQPPQPAISMATLSLSLWPADLSYAQSKQNEYAETAPVFVSLWPREKRKDGSSLALFKKHDEDLHAPDEVDTSLHL